MLERSREIQTLDELRDYVYQIMCQHDHLEIGAFQMTEQVLLRGSRPCGIYYCLHGPREVRFIAIWETDRNTILFYNAAGERYHKTQLVEAPSLELTAA